MSVDYYIELIIKSMYTPEFEFLVICVTIVTTCLQVYVLYLVKNCSPNTMNEYKFFLYMLTLWDIAFCVLLGLFLDPDPLPESPSAVIQGVSARFGKFGPLIAVSFYSFKPVINKRMIVFRHPLFYLQV